MRAARENLECLAKHQHPHRVYFLINNLTDLNKRDARLIFRGASLREQRRLGAPTNLVVSLCYIWGNLYAGFMDYKVHVYRHFRVHIYTYSLSLCLFT